MCLLCKETYLFSTLILPPVFGDCVSLYEDTFHFAISNHVSNTSDPSSHVLLFISNMASTAMMHIEQEGQHPLTGQRAANFRLMANQ